MKQLCRILIISLVVSSMPLASAWAQCVRATTIWAEHARDSFGEKVAGRTDINNDGTPDIIITAPGWDSLGGSASHGRVYVYSGVDLSLQCDRVHALLAHGADACG